MSKITRRQGIASPILHKYGQHVWFYRLGGQGYAPVESSVVFNGVTTQDSERCIETGRETDRQVWFDEVRDWASR